MTIVTPKELEDMVYEASKSAFSELLRDNPEERFYVFGLWTDDSLQFLHAAANTESGLDRTVRHYNETVDPQYGITSTHHDMRWAYGDWVFFTGVGEEQFGEINEKLSDVFDLDVSIEEFGEIIAPLWRPIVDGFARLDAEGFFGEGDARARVTLLIVGDLPEELTDEYARILNPAPVADAYVGWFAE